MGSIKLKKGEIVEYLDKGDLIVFNDSKVIPARFFAKKQKEEANIIGMSFEKFKKWFWGEDRIWDKEGNYPGHPDKIIFAGLPGPCDIRIYTISGDLVQHLEHTAITGIHEWNQITRYNQYIVSGIYVYHVRDKNDGNEKFGKFIIIR